MLNGTNATEGVASHAPPPPWEVVVYALLASWIMVANGLLVLSIMLHPQRRAVPFNLHVANLSVVYLLVGVAVLPLLASTYSHGSWSHGEDLCMFWLVCDGILATCAILSVFMLNLNRFFHAIGRTSGHLRYVVCAAMLGSAWVLALLLVVCFVLASMDRRDAMYGTCALTMPEVPTVSYLVLTYFIPAVFVLAINAAVITLFFVLPGGRQRHMDPAKRRRQAWQVGAVTAVSLSAVLWWAPWAILNVSLAVGSGGGGGVTGPRSGLGLSAAYLLSYLAAALHPLLWLLYPGCRRALRDLFCCRLGSKRAGPIYRATVPPDDPAARIMPEHEDPDQTTPLELHQA